MPISIISPQNSFWIIQNTLLFFTVYLVNNLPSCKNRLAGWNLWATMREEDEKLGWKVRAQLNLPKRISEGSRGASKPNHLPLIFPHPEAALICLKNLFFYKLKKISSKFCKLFGIFTTKISSFKAITTFHFPILEIAITLPITLYNT